MSFYHGTNVSEVIQSGKASQYDLFISDLNYFEKYTKTLYMPSVADNSAWQDLRTAVDPNYTYFPKINENRFCYSFNSECLMLFYRNDIFSEQEERRLFYEAFYNELNVPKTLDEFDRIANYFNRSSNPVSPILYGLAMSPINSERFWQEFFWRIFASSAELVDEYGRLHFDHPSVIDACNRFFDCLSRSNASGLNQTGSAVDEFARGNCVLSIMSTGDAAVFNDNRFGAISEHIKCFDSPSSKPIVKSNVIGIVDGSKKLAESCAFLKWVFHNSVSNILTLMSGQPITKSSTSNNEILSLYPWLKYFEVSMSNGELLSSLFTDCIFNSNFRKEFIYSITNAYNNGSKSREVLSNLQSLYEKGAFN